MQSKPGQQHPGGDFRRVGCWLFAGSDVRRVPGPGWSACWNMDNVEAGSAGDLQRFAGVAWCGGRRFCRCHMSILSIRTACGCRLHEALLEGSACGFLALNAGRNAATNTVFLRGRERCCYLFSSRRLCVVLESPVAPVGEWGTFMRRQHPTRACQKYRRALSWRV